MTKRNNGQEKTNPHEVTEAYHKARRNYGFFSGLLIAWELIGIDVKESPLQNFNVVLKNPEATPYVLIALILYFSFRITVEWFQCDLDRRMMRPSKVDFYTSHLIGIAAIGLYSIQRLLDFQLADKFQSSFFQLGSMSLALGLILSESIRRYAGRKESKFKKWHFVLFGGMLLAPLFEIIRGVRYYNAEHYLIIVVCGLIGFIITFIITKVF